MESTHNKRNQHAPKHRKAEEDLRANRRALRAVFDAIPHSLYVKDLEGRYLMVNKALARFVGRPEEDIVGTLTSEARPIRHPISLRAWPRPTARSPKAESLRTSSFACTTRTGANCGSATSRCRSGTMPDT